MPTTLIVLLLTALALAVGFAANGVWAVTALNVTLVALVLVQYGRDHQWIGRAWLWRLEAELRMLDREIDDTDDDILTERCAHGPCTERGLVSILWLRDLHDRRRVLCTDITAVRTHLRRPAADLQHVSAWADRSAMVDLTAHQADAEVRRIRSL